MKVCVLGSRSYPPAMGGIETHIYELAPRLAARGHEMNIIVSSNTWNKHIEMIGKVYVIKVPMLKSHLIAKLSMVPFVSAAIKEIQPDLYHAHDATFGFISSTFYQDCSTVYTAHAIAYRSVEWKFPMNKILKIYQTTAFKKAAAVMCVDYATLEVVKRYRDDCILIYNGVDTKQFGLDYACPVEYNAGKVKLLSVGRLVHVKGLEYLFEALRRLEEGVRNKVELYVIGAGVLETRLKEKSANLPVKFLGPVEHSKIMPYYKHADVFILPSLSEGLPISLLEAMGSGRPCICTAVGDIPKRFKNEKELIVVPPKNASALAEALTKLIADENLRCELGKNAQKTIVKGYSWDNVADIVDGIYKKIDKK